MSSLTAEQVETHNGKWCWLSNSANTTLRGPSFHDTLRGAKDTFDAALEASPTTVGTLLMLPEKVYKVSRVQKDVLSVTRVE